jgi:hypothetical protein
MHFVEHGLYVCLDRLKSFYMSGAGRHVGTPALSPINMRGTDIPKHYARAVAIAYAAKKILDGNRIIWPLCPLPNETIIEWTPEMSSIKYVYFSQFSFASCELTTGSLDSISNSQGPIRDILSMAKEGPYIAGDPEAFCQWYAQVLHGLNLYMWGQVSKDFKPRIDPTHSIPSTSVEIDGRRVLLEPWDLGPDRLENEMSDRLNARQAAAAEWKEFCEKRERYHPVLGRRTGGMNENEGIFRLFFLFFPRINCGLQFHINLFQSLASRLEVSL